MMSAAQSQTTLMAKLEALQCHFTWDLEPNRTKLLRLNDKLVDIGTEQGNSWLGHIYNLQGFIHYMLGSTEDAQSFFNQAAEAFSQMRNADDGPWLVVNYGNLAWLHHHLGDQAESEAYLSKVDALMKKYPSPSQDELHAETYAEKAWTLMKFSTDRELVADYFQRAIRMQPDMVEWNTSHVIGLARAFKHTDTGLPADILEKVKVAKEHDPENVFLAAYYLQQRAKKGEDVEDEAHELSQKILRNPVSSYSGMKAMLRVYKNYESIYKAIDLAEEALEHHPDERYLKRCAALCYKWKISYFSDSRPKKSMIDRAVSLHEEVISLYPHSSLVKKIDLANIHAKCNHDMAKAEQMYQDLLRRDLEPAEQQVLYNIYAKYLNHNRRDEDKSITYHMKAAAILEQSFYRWNSIKVLEKIKNRRRNRMCGEIKEFLENLAAQSQTTLMAKLEALQCHFTWDLEPNRTKLLRLNDKLVDIGTEQGNSWLGHIYNLQGFIQFKLGFTEDAQSFFNQAAEAFSQMRNADDGPWLVVNYGNLAWLHHHLGDQAESEAYLSKVDALMKKYPSPSQDELHAETYAEKAWTLMKSNADRELVADYFQRAIRMQPDMVECNTSHVIGLARALKYDDTGLPADILEQVRVAKEQDPENLYLAAYYLEQRAKKGEDVEDEAHELAQRILRNPVSSHSGMKTIVRFYRNYVSIDKAIDLAEEALKRHPDERYLKSCAALCYKWKIIYFSDSRPKKSMTDRAVSLHEEVISLYPHSSLMKKIDLANIHAKYNHDMAKAEQMYQDLLRRGLEPKDKQILYNNYAKYLNYDRRDENKSIQYHMNAAAIPQQSSCRGDSIKILEKIKNQRRNQMCGEIEEFLKNLAAQSQTTLMAKLEALQCHFTWDLEPNRKKLLRLNDKLVDIGTEQGNSWLGHIYNLRGFIHYMLGSTKDAQSFFNQAAEAFSQMRNADDGPWLVVNYGNLAWLHHHLGDQAESEAYLSKVDALMKKYPSPSQDELHAETYAEKAWTLMKFKSLESELVADYFQRAIRMQPDMVEWNTSHVILLARVFKHNDTGVPADYLEKVRVAKEQDPENLYLAAYYLQKRAKNREDVQDEAHELAQKVLRNPVSSYSGMKAIIRVYRNSVSIDKAIDLAEEALEHHPDERFLKRCAALCYKWKIIYFSNGRPKKSMIDRAVSLHEEVISLYPHSSLMKKIDLANIHAKCNHGMAKAEQMYQDLLRRDLEPKDKQVLYNNYAKYLNFDRRDENKSIQYHMNAAAIPQQSSCRGDSIKILKKIKNRRRSRMCGEIEEFLKNLQEP